MIQPDDLTKLRQELPAWNFGSVWASAASGPDRRRLWATRDGMLLSAWTAAELAGIFAGKKTASTLGS
jgi:hypothetical protein